MVSILNACHSEQLRKWEKLRQRYPVIISCCLTNFWLLSSLRAQVLLARNYELVRTNCLILQAEDDIFVHNRAMSMFIAKAPASRSVSKIIRDIVNNPNNLSLQICRTLSLPLFRLCILYILTNSRAGYLWCQGRTMMSS